MITDEVIREIYETQKKPPKDLNDLHLPDALYELKKHHSLTLTDDDLTQAEVIINDLGQWDPFRCFLVRSLNAILEFDRTYAFVFKNHILFLNKDDSELRVHFKPEDDDEIENDDDEEDGRSFLGKLFGRKKR